MTYHQSNLTEGLRPLDLREMVYPTFEIDTFKSKMGEDRDVCVLSFQVKERAPATDLMEFIEKGFHYVLDADVSAGEDNQGEYAVFIEIPRTERLPQHIQDITYGVRKLTGIDDFKFRFFKEDSEHAASEDTLKSVIPNSPEKYDGLMTKIKTEGIKKFFSKTLMDDLSLDGNIITIHKPFNQQIRLEMIEDESETILEGSAYEADEQAMSAIFWLTKVLGDYNINKIGESFVFNNDAQSMILRRVD